MRDLFVYGTLCHLPLLHKVLGHTDVVTRPATLSGARVTWVAGADFPMITLGVEGRADGLVLQGVSEADRSRLDFYEGGYGYALAPVETSAGSAEVYLPGSDVGPPGDDWSLDDWVLRHGAITVEAAGEVMAHMPHRSARAVAAMSDVIRKRAAARLRAGARAPMPMVMQGDVVLEDVQLPYAEFFATQAFDIRHARFDGTVSRPLRRAVWLGMDAAFVLPYDPVRDRVLLVEQVRMGPIARGDTAQWQLEPIAGHVDVGETPQEAARREALEEAGVHVGHMEAIAECYASPGNSTEYFYLHVALADLPDGIEGVRGVEAEGENIRSHLVSFAALLELVEAQQIANTPLIVLALWLARHRDRLRAHGTT